MAVFYFCWHSPLSCFCPTRATDRKKRETPWAKLTDRIFFDKQDRDILVLVNRILEAPNVPSRDNLFNPELHPHGIKELVTSPASRMAYAVINLLRNLEVGGSRDRLLALQTLYDEVLTSAHSALRRNTARALMQIMKDMVRAHGDETRQLMLAHDFRSTALGTPRVVRRMLARYHLPEMPEAWNQLAFDDHVYDVNTKGRKTPTHLIMDAWIKGLRSITVVYDNSVDAGGRHGGHPRFGHRGHLRAYRPGVQRALL